MNTQSQHNNNILPDTMYSYRLLDPLLLTWINFNPSMDK